MAALYLWFRHLTTGYDDGKGVMRIKNMQIYRKNCWWRKERVSQKARQVRSRFFVMRRCLAAILVWEAVIAIGGIFPIKDMDFCIVEKEEDCAGSNKPWSPGRCIWDAHLPGGVENRILPQDGKSIQAKSETRSTAKRQRM